MKEVIKIIEKHLSKARKAYDQHLKNRESYNGSYLMGRYASLADVLHEVETIEARHAKTKTKKVSR